MLKTKLRLFVHSMNLQSPVRLYTPSEIVVSRILAWISPKVPVRTLKTPIIAESTKKDTMLIKNAFPIFMRIN